MDEFLNQLPQCVPFRFISEVTMMHPGVSGAARWLVTGDEAFVAGHFPGQPIVPGVLLTESMAQLAGLVGFAHSPEPVRAAKLAHIDIRFGAAVTPPAIVQLHAKLIRSIGRLMLFEVAAQWNEVSVASGTLTLADGMSDMLLERKGV